MMDTEAMKGDLVTVTLFYGEGEIHQVHGRWTGSRLKAVLADGVSVYTCTPREAEGQGLEDHIDEWHSIYTTTGRDLPAPAGARGIYGSQEPNSPFRLVTNDWRLGPTCLEVRDGSDLVTVEPLTADGRAYIDANLSTAVRRTRMEERLRALDPTLADDLEDLLWRVEEDARYEERRNSYQ